MEIIIGIIIVAICFGISLLLTCGVLKLICLCFGWVWSWKIAIGIWLVMILLRVTFSRSED